MKQYNIGDEVIIKNEDELYKIYPQSATRRLGYANRKFKIKEILNKTYYLFEVDENEFLWTSSMFVPSKKEKFDLKNLIVEL